MAESVSLEMQGWIVSTLRNDPGLQALLGQRVYDRVPDAPVFPYISYGPETESNEYPDCIDAASLEIQLDAWSREVGYPEVKRIDAAVHAALHDQDIALPVNACCCLYHVNTLFLRDPDGLTNHAVIQLEAYVERT